MVWALNFGVVTDFNRWGFRGKNMLSWDWLKSMDWVSWLRLRPIFLQKAMALAEGDFSSSLASKLGIHLPPSMRGKNDFWAAQNFWLHYQDVHSPVMIWGNKNDSLVPFDENAGTLNQDNVGVVKFPVGYHCTLPIGYDWSALSSLVQANLVSKESPMKFKIDSFRIDLAPSYDSKPESWFIDQMIGLVISLRMSVSICVIELFSSKIFTCLFP